jgi:hypothetical protein
MLNLHQWEDNHIISLLIVIYRGKISGTIHVMIILQEKKLWFHQPQYPQSGKTHHRFDQETFRKLSRKSTV